MNKYFIYVIINMYMDVYIYIYMCIYVYIYIYICMGVSQNAVHTPVVAI